MPRLDPFCSSLRHFARASALVFAATLARGEEISFQGAIRPLLEKQCFDCHGAKKQKGGLRLDRKVDILRGGDSNHAPFVAGKSGESEMFKRIISDDPDEQMPPPGKGADRRERLTAEQVARLKGWIDNGAAMPDDGSMNQAKHWAYVKPVARPLPEVKAAAWSRNGVDRWVLARLEKEGLKPSVEAERAVLLRRVSLDLTGLPPTLEEVEAFLADGTPGAYEKAVDRLLASPAYGERWARPWLDLARYADTNGYEADHRRNMWPWRDWVIDALNRDLPFDQFTVEQIAGDLLPGATEAQKVATGFHRNTMTNTEGGTDDEEFRYEAVVDRINTTFAVWMGTTIACAQCHNHKYDPFLTKEYYQFMAFLNNTADADRGDHAPTIQVVPAEQREKYAQLQAARREAEKLAANPVAAPQFIAAQAEWEKLTSAELAAAQAASEDVLAPADAKTPAGPALPADIREIFGVAAADRDEPQRARLREHYRSISPEVKQLTAAAASAKKATDDFAKALPTTAVMAELDKPRVTKRHIRGAYLSTAEEVQPATPAALHPFPANAPANRLGLARWMVDRENPLTARVIVNRTWEQFFGRGIVETVEEFGKQGEPPTHPELLDWLAVQFMDGAGGGKPWSTKALHKLIVTSATYRQSSRVVPETRERDPDNRLLARGPRVRLEAEMIRDQALAVSGLLSRKIGGPSVMPPQPDGLWQIVYSGDAWKTSGGEDKYRRGLYTFWRRSMPHPLMTTFDAPSREFCVLRRNRSDTPLQALNTLNDRAFIEAAQALARRVAATPGDVRARIAFAFRTCLARLPTEAEIVRLEKLYESESAHYRTRSSDAEHMAASELGKPPGEADLAELAAWTVVANVLLNLDEMISKG
ncbi:MAG: PSD1 and planctomycete cytochrome C domain-containing protein [Chthoniobacter sp.]|nr:PSD1 and planctomycete cytochrome C domain-containing protein [Chthoniobacter sp.]